MHTIRYGIVMTLVGFLFTLGCGQMSQEGMCEGGYLDCDFVCVDPLTDPQNCGGCGLACSSDEVCSLGSCEPGQNNKLLIQAA